MPNTIDRIDHVGLNVADLDVSIAFYRALFGFTVLARWDTPRQAFIGTPTTSPGETTPSAPAVLGLIETPDYDFRRHTMAHLAFPCTAETFPDFVARIRAMALEIVSGPKPQRGGETILFRDPSGNILEVCYPSLQKWLAMQQQQAQEQ